MYQIKLSNDIPKPQPVSSDYIVAAHYYAAWKKGAAEIHNGFDDLHDYPERTPLMGYYDEENPDVCDWEIKWAVEHGINCFIHCWYRKKQNEGHPVTAADLRCGHGLHEALFHATYQKYMKFAIMYEAQPRWGGTDADDLIRNLMPFWTETYFKRDNYLKIDNKPVLFIYDTKFQIRDAFATPEAQKAAFDRCREYAKAQGFDGLIIAAENHSDDPAVAADFKARGYDFRFAYAYYYAGEAQPTEDFIVQDQRDWFEKRIAIDPKGYVPTATCFRDAEPRCTQHWIDMGFGFHREKRWYVSPDNFRRVLRNCKAMSDALPEDAPGKKIIMIDNWNEWDEGHFVAPSHKFGFRYLQAIREELTHRDNLPDYRMPQDLGFTGYNKSWGEPDLSEVCKKKFGVTYDE